MSRRPWRSLVALGNSVSSSDLENDPKKKADKPTFTEKHALSYAWSQGAFSQSGQVQGVTGAGEQQSKALSDQGRPPRAVRSHPHGQAS